MRIGQQGRAGLLKARHATALLLALCTAGHVAWAATPKPAVSAKGVPAAIAPTASPEVQIAPVPAWVQALPVDPAMQLPAAPVQLLLADRQTRLDPAGTVRFSRWLRRINDSAGLQKGAQIEVEFDPSFQRLSWHRLDVIRDGKRINRLDRRAIKLLLREKQLEQQQLDGRMTASVVLEDLRPGDQIEWAYSLRGDNPVFGGKFVEQVWLSSSQGPIGLTRYRLLAPAARPLQFQVREQGVEVAESSLFGQVERVWTRRAVPQFVFDPSVPAWAYGADLLQISEFANWADVAAWAQQLFAEASKPSAEVDAFLRQLGEQDADPQRRLALALDFVQRDIRYFGTEIGASSHQPAASALVLQRRFGDCKDKTNLMVQVARALGFKAEPVLVNTGLKAHTAEQLPSPLAFDHVIVRLTLGEQQLWLDPTRHLQTGALAARSVTGLGRGLLARAAEQELVAIPDGQSLVRMDSSDLWVFPSKLAPGTLQSSTVYRGEMAEWLREMRASLPAEEWQKILRGELLRLYPTLVADGDLAVEEVPEDNAIRVRGHYRVGEEFWRLADATLQGEVGLGSLAALLRLNDQNPRTQAMNFGMPGRYLHVTQLDFGSKRLPASTSKAEDKGEAFDLQVRYRVEPQRVQIEGELQVKQPVIEPAQWKAHRDRLVRIWPKLSSVIRLPTVDLEGQAVLRERLQTLPQDLAKLQPPLKTRVQVQSYVEALIKDYIVGADQLPPKPRAQLLLDLAVAQDHLGHFRAAERSLAQAQAIDPGNAGILAAQAVNAFSQGQDERALDFASQALTLDPAGIAPRYTRVHALYFLERYEDAARELATLLQRAEPGEQRYALLWRHLVARRQGQPLPEAVPGEGTADEADAWPLPILQLYRGELDFAAALKLARAKPESALGRECELYFFAAQQALAEGRQAQARAWLKSAVDTGVVEFIEYNMARREVARLEKLPNAVRDQGARRLQGQ